MAQAASPADPALARPIPAALNLAIAAIQLAGMLGLLWWVSHASSVFGLVFGLAAFCLLGQSLFSLIHEAEHDKLHPDPRVNVAVGVLLSALFPGSFSILRAGHLTHHGRNRTDAELIDYFRPHEGRWRKTFKYYTVFLGTIWAGIVALSVLVCFLPGRFFRLPEDHERGADVATYLSFLAEVKRWRVRAETAFVILFWGAMSHLLDLGWQALAAYGLFGVIWGSQQFIFHVRTPMHLVEGSWDLRVWPIFGWPLLHFNYHLTHHRHPRQPWIYLPELAEERPWRPYMLTWARLFLPPRPYAVAWPQQLLTRGPLPPDPPPEFQRPEARS